MEYCGVVIPTYVNDDSRLNLLKRSLLSVVEQTYENTIGIIIDDGSYKIREVQEIINDINSSKLRFLRRDRNPIDLNTSSNALNFGLEMVLDTPKKMFFLKEMENICGVCYLHSDDVLPRTSVEKRIKVLGDVDVVYGVTKTFNKYGSVLEQPFDSKKKNLHYLSNTISHHSVMWSLDFLFGLRDFADFKYQQDGVFDKNLDAQEDRDVTLLTLKYVRERKKKIKFIDDIVYKYFIHENSICGNLSQEHDNEIRNIINKKHKIVLDLYLERLTNDLPFSLFAYMIPNSIKEKYLRGIRDNLKGVFK